MKTRVLIMGNSQKSMDRITDMTVREVLDPKFAALIETLKVDKNGIIMIRYCSSALRRK